MVLGVEQLRDITAESHECEEVLDLEYTPTNDEKECSLKQNKFLFFLYLINIY